MSANERFGFVVAIGLQSHTLLNTTASRSRLAHLHTRRPS